MAGRARRDNETWVSPSAAKLLSGVTTADLDAAVALGAVRTKVIHKITYVSLTDCDRLAGITPDSGCRCMRERKN